MSLAFCLLLAASPEWLGPSGAPSTGAHRIVSLAPSLTEILFAIGAGDRVVAVTRFDDWPEQVRNLPRVGGFIDPDVEAVFAQRPDLVVAVRSAAARRTHEALGRLGIPVLVLPAETVGDLWFAIETLGQITAQQQAAHALTRKLKRELEQISAAAKQGPSVRALIVVGYRPLIAAGPDSFLGELLSYLNAHNVVPADGGFFHLDWEAVLGARPDVVIEATMGRGAPTAAWRRLAAAGYNPRVVHIEESALLRLGPRLPEGMRLLARALRPSS